MNDTWTEDDFSKFVQFLSAKKDKTLDEKQLGEMKEFNLNHGMYLAVLFSRHIDAEIIEHHRKAIISACKENGLIGEKFNSLCPISIRRQLVKYIHEDKFVIIHEGRKISIPEGVIDSVEVQTTVSKNVIQIVMVNNADNSPKRREHVVQFDVADESPAKITSEILTCFMTFLHKIVMFVDQDRLIRYA